jgi:hypothetical protein
MRPNNRVPLLGLTAATFVFTVILVFAARPTWTVAVVGMLGASVAAVGSVGITASATSFRRIRAQPRVEPEPRAQTAQAEPRVEPEPRAQTAQTEPRVEPEPRAQTAQTEPRVEPERQARAQQQAPQPQQRAQAPRLPGPPLRPEQQLTYLENERQQILRDLERLAQEERRRGRLTREQAQFRERLRQGLSGAEQRIAELERGQGAGPAETS